MTGKRLDADWYRVKYNLAAQSLNYTLELRRRVSEAAQAEALDAATVADGAGWALKLDECFSRAETHSRELVQAAAETLETPMSRRSRRTYAGLRAFLAATLEPSAAILFAGASILRSPKPAVRSGSIEERVELVRVVASGGPSPGPIVAYAISLPRTTYRVHYNLACFLATLSETIAAASSESQEIRAWADPHPADELPAERRAFAALTQAIERAPAEKADELVHWARSDPALAPIAGMEDFEHFVHTKSAVQRYKDLIEHGPSEAFGGGATPSQAAPPGTGPGATGAAG